MCGPASTAAPACRGAQDADGNPVVSPTTVDYTGIKLGDVQGWAPTPGTFGFNKNYCVAGAEFESGATVGGIMIQMSTENVSEARDYWRFASLYVFTDCHVS